MTIQLSTAIRNAMLDQAETVIGASAKLRIYTGAMPANPAAAATGTLLITVDLPSNWMADASGGAKGIAGSWTGTAIAPGTTGYYRIWDNGITACGEQGTIGQSVVIATNALTAANGNVLNFASTTGVVAGMNIAGTGIPAGATVLAFTGTTVTMTMTSSAGVASAASISFSHDMAIDNAVLANGQTVNITAKTLTAPNA